MADLGPDRLRVALYLDANGPTPGDELAAALGLTLEEFWPLVGTYPGFKITGRGWTLADRGYDEFLPDRRAA